jgi:hypothetical protein
LPLNCYNAIKCPKWPKYIPNCQRIFQPFPFRGPPKFTQIGSFGLKMYHLATLFCGTKWSWIICIMSVIWNACFPKHSTISSAILLIARLFSQQNLTVIYYIFISYMSTGGTSKYTTQIILSNL